MRARSLCSILGAVPCAPLLAQGDYTPQLVGPGVVVNDMNELGEVVGWTLDGGVQAFVGGPNRPHELLPLPEGYASGWAQGINDDTAVVGSVSTGGFPEFGEAVAWYPTADGSWSVEFLGQLPGSTQSVAYDVNNRGDIVGVSLTPGFGGGPTVWFNSPTGVLNLSALGAPSSPKQVNDERVVVGISGGLFDLDSLSAQPLPPFPAGTNNFQCWAINEKGELAGKAFHGSQISASIWTAGGSWQKVSSEFDSSALVQAFDINDSGLTYAEVPAPAAYVPGTGTVLLASLVVPDQQASWSFLTNLGGAVNDAGQIAAIGLDAGSGSSGVAVLTPDSGGFVDLGQGLAGTAGVPRLDGIGTLSPGDPTTLAVNQALPDSVAFLVVGLTDSSVPALGGTLVPSPDAVLALQVGTNGSLVFSAAWPPLPSGTNLWVQSWIVDPAGPLGFSASNALRATGA